MDEGDALDLYHHILEKCPNVNASGINKFI